MLELGDRPFGVGLTLEGGVAAERRAHPFSGRLGGWVPGGVAVAVVLDRRELGTQARQRRVGLDVGGVE